MIAHPSLSDYLTLFQQLNTAKNMDFIVDDQTSGKRKNFYTSTIQLIKAIQKKKN